MADSIEYTDILQEVRGSLNPGRLKLADTNVIFKNLKTGKVDQISSADIDTVQWLVRARGYCLKILTHQGYVHRFDGFKDTEFEKLSSFIEKNYNAELKKQDVSLRGWNYGATDFVGNSLDFRVNDKFSFDIPLENVSHSTAAKNEVVMEFHVNDNAAVSVTELRFHIPASTDPEADPVQDFYKAVVAKADIIQATGDAIAIFSEVQCFTPRGRYDIKLFPSFLQLHGKTFDYKIPYKTILRLFLLPHRDRRQVYFMISVDPPIKQGQTRYHFLIFVFNNDDETTLELGLSEEDIQEKYEGKLTKEMSGPEFEIVSRIMKCLVNRKITVPGTFASHAGSNCVSCSYKANSGFLYPLERGLVFVHKPPMHIRFDEIADVNFSRGSGSTRSFDFEVTTKTGAPMYTFSSISKEEYGKLYDFVKNKKLRVKNIGNRLDQPNYADDMMDSEGEDHDAYMVKMKREGDEMYEEDEDDEEYLLPDDMNSEVEEEFDTEYESTSDDDSSEVDSDASDSVRRAKERRKRERKQKKREEREARGEPRKKKKKPVKEGGATKRKRKSDKDVDPNKPKRPMSAYFLWLNENREKIKEENPGISVTEVASKSGEIWRGLSSSDKKPHEDKSAELKVEYEKAMEEWRAAPFKDGGEKTGGEEPREKKKKKKKSKPSPSKPKTEPSGGTGSSFKSKEFISDSSDSGGAESGDSDEKPLKKKAKKEKKKEKKEKEEKSEGGESSPDEDFQGGSGSDESSEEEEKPTKRRTRGSRKDGEEESDAGSLPDEEDILSSPEHSAPEDNKSGSESEAEGGDDEAGSEAGSGAEAGSAKGGSDSE